MSPTIDSAGRLVIPKKVREAAGLHPGTQVRFRVESEGVLIEPAPLSVILERRGTMVVAVAPAGTPQMKESDVARTIEELRGMDPSADPTA
ncbi:MAG: AbrB/MazE/SpoVT family DNA-binding domain-containing protein [Rhodospirillales bacterium]|nr:AbrB/MazE/SpoVT family DNA-binding domain-containing protein [Rhodospirillales bacterium]